MRDFFLCLFNNPLIREALALTHALMHSHAHAHPNALTNTHTHTHERFVLPKVAQTHSRFHRGIGMVPLHNETLREGERVLVCIFVRVRVKESERVLVCVSERDRERYKIFSCSLSRKSLLMPLIKVYLSSFLQRDRPSKHSKLQKSVAAGLHGDARLLGNQNKNIPVCFGFGFLSNAGFVVKVGKDAAVKNFCSASTKRVLKTFLCFFETEEVVRDVFKPDEGDQQIGEFDNLMLWHFSQVCQLHFTSYQCIVGIAH